MIRTGVHLGGRKARLAGFTDPWRRLLAHPLAILAIAFQCLIVQTHIDGIAAQPTAVAGLSAPAVAQDDDARAPVGDRQSGHKPANCPICQAAALGTGALIASAPAIQLSHHAALANAPVPIAPSLPATPSHDWRGRGPPILHSIA